MRRQMEQLALLDWCGMSRATSPVSPAAGRAVEVEMDMDMATTPTLSEIETRLLGGVCDVQPVAGIEDALATPTPIGGADGMDLDGYDAADAALRCRPAAAAAAVTAAVTPGFGAACTGNRVSVPILSESAAMSRLVARRKQRHRKKQTSKGSEAESAPTFGCQPKRY